MDCDSLLVVCSFLNWSELLIFSHSCQANRAVAVRSPPRNVRVYVNGEVLQSILSSSMRRHVNELHESKGDHLKDPCWSFAQLLSQRMPWLNQLHLHVPLSDTVNDTARSLPQELSRLIFCIDSPTITSTDVSSDTKQVSRSTEQLLSTFVSTIATTAPRLRSLCILLDHTIQSKAPIAMLQQVKAMPSLTELETNALILTEPEGVCVLRSLPQLRRLTSFSTFWTTDQLNQLTAGQFGVDYPPLESIEPADVDYESTEAILKLPSLTRLHPPSLDSIDLHRLLSGLSNLTSFRAIIDNVVRPRTRSKLLLLISALHSLREQSKISSLHLQHRLMTAQQVGTVICCLPQLTELTLEGSFQVLSLDFLSAMPSSAASKLESFTLSRCGPMHPKEILHLGALHRLRSLHLWSSFTESPPNHVMASMDPNDANFDAKTWPMLKNVDIRGLAVALMDASLF